VSLDGDQSPPSSDSVARLNQPAQPPIPPPYRQLAGTGSSQLIPTPLRVTSELAARLLVIAAALAAVVFVIIQLWVVVIPVAIALLLSALLAPLVETAVHRVGLPRGLATVLVLVGGIALLSVVLSAVINAFIDGLPELQAKLIQSYQVSIQPLLAGPPLHIQPSRLNDLPGALQRSIMANSEAITTGALSTAATVTGLLAGLLLGLFVLIFFLYDGERIWSFLMRAIPMAARARADVAGRQAFASLVGYTRAVVAVAVADASAIALGLWFIGTPLVIPLAALVFLGAFVPMVGAILSGAVTVLVTLVAKGPVSALIVLGVVIAVIQLDGHVLQPLLLGRAVALHPLAVVLSVAGGIVVAGIAGAMLAVPLVAVLATGVRSLATTAVPPPDKINPLDPEDAESARPEPPEPRPPRRLKRLKVIIAGVTQKIRASLPRRPRPGR